MRRYLLLPLLFLTACQPKEQVAEMLHEPAPVWPDYNGTVLPINLVPIRLALTEGCKLVSPQAIFSAGDQKCVVAGKNREFAISIDQWNELKDKASDIKVRIQGQRDGRWVEFDPITLTISTDSIDQYLCYRLIEPGYEVWNEMGIYERDLHSYEERPFLTNRQTNGGCMNCHSFNQRTPDEMLFHLRMEMAGTYIIKGGEIEKLNTKTPETISPLVYPYWHPSGRFVAFSTNDTQQVAHSTDHNRIEVFDNRSDVVVYDVERHQLLISPLLKSDQAFETFPTFSPDGRTLYFCSADSVNVKSAYQDVHYSLCSIGFDDATGTFGQTVDTLYNARVRGGSVSFPRISPDGRWLMFTHHGYGNFSIWHKDADLWMMDLSATTEEATPKRCEAANSDEVESYHSWSSNGRWVVFSSRRMDGLYTRPYLTYVSEDGICSKAALLPQRDIHYYDRMMKSYNIPELINGSLKSLAEDINKAAKTEGKDVKVKK